jgi:2-iminobutanoate/2-iminopropanoate deaminase
MSLRVIRTELAPAAIGPYSQAVEGGGWLFVSGQIGLDPATGQMAAGGFADQARQALKNLQRIVEAAGYRLADVVAVDVFLTDISEFAAFNSLYEGYFSEHKPARAVVEVKGLPRGALVEIKCTAYRKE